MGSSNSAAALEFLLAKVRGRAICNGGSVWDLNLTLPVAPTLEEALRIAMQDWQGSDEVEYYVLDLARHGEWSLRLVRGRPVQIEELPGELLAVRTDEDHRFRWRVTAIGCGRSICAPKPSAESAVESVRAKITQYGRGQMLSSFSTARDQQAVAQANKECRRQDRRD